MAHLCIGSYTRVLCSGARKADAKFDGFCETIMLSLANDGETQLSYLNEKNKPVTYNESNYGKLHSSAQDLPDKLAKRATKVNPERVRLYFERTVIPMLDESKKKMVVCALKDLILKDSDIDENQELGALTRIKKKDLRGMRSFALPAFLADLFLFAATSTNNTTDPNFTKSIKKNHCTQFAKDAEEINLYSLTNQKPALVEVKEMMTAIGSFEDIFHPASSESLGITPPHGYEIYYLRFNDQNFDYEALQEHLLCNIGYYLFSRAEISDYVKKGKTATIAHRAIQELKRSSSSSDAEKLGRLMLYVFLEQALHAPKLASRIEIDKSGQGIPSTSSGVYLLPGTATLSSQLLIGTSMIDGDLHAAIDRAFSDAEELNKSKSRVRNFVESSIFERSLPDDVAEQFMSILVPKRSPSKPETAFGMFLGYTLRGVSRTNMRIQEYQDAVKARLRNDLKSALPYVQKKIAECGIQAHSIYIFLLPFQDAASDSTDIMKKLEG